MESRGKAPSSLRVAGAQAEACRHPAPISEGKAAEAAIEQSVARFRSCFDLPLVGMAITSPRTRFVEVNDRICQILGYCREELLQMDWAQITHPDDLQANLDTFQRLLAGELDGFTLDKRFIRKDGQTIQTRISVGSVRRTDGALDYTCVSVQDISERTRAEQALQASEARFRTLVDNAPSAISISRNGTILYVNQKFVSLFAIDTVAPLIGSSILELFAAETRSEIKDLRARHLRGEINSVAFEGMAQRRNDTRFPVQIEATVVHLPDGPAILTFLTDATQRTAAQNAIREAERQYRDIFIEAPEGIFRVTQMGQLLAVNPAGARMLGYGSAAEALAAGEDIARAMWFSGEQRKSFVRLMETIGEVHDFQCEFRCKDGSPLWVSLSARRVADGVGQTLYYQGFLENLSEKKRLEQKLKGHIREIQLLSEMNNALLHATNEENLLREYCRIVVETGGYRMAWVGFAHAGPEKRVVPVAHYGHEDGYLKTANVTWDETDHGRGAIGQAIRTGQITVVDPLPEDARMLPWRDEAVRCGYKSIIAIPFGLSEGRMACLTAYGSGTNTWSPTELRLMEQIAAALGFGITTVRTAIARDRYQRDLHSSLEQTIEVISETIDQRDPYTSGHQRRVADLCARIGEKLGLDPYRIQGLRLAATIHDLGKIGIPAEILVKPGQLTRIQFDLIKEHARLGYDIVKNVTFPWPIGDIILQHHERLDGSGYPQGLREDAILLEARILAVADTVEAMGSHRPYRATRGIDAALAEVVAAKGTLYDPDAVDACVALFQQNGYAFPA